MTTSELCELFSEEISNTFELSKDTIKEYIFRDITSEMTEKQVYSKMIINSILVSSSLSTQVIISGLVSLGVISEDYVDSLKVRPKIHLVKPSTNHSPSDSEE